MIEKEVKIKSTKPIITYAMQGTVLLLGCGVVCAQTLSSHPLFLLHDVPRGTKTIKGISSCFFTKIIQSC